MIAREWKCRCPHRHRDGFLEYLDQTGVSETSSLEGFQGFQILERDTGDIVEIVLVTYWNSLEDVKRFAGEIISEARLYPEDYKYEIEPDLEVKHYRVLESSFKGMV